MSTFAELQSKLLMARERKALLQYIVDHLESDFLSASQNAIGSFPKKVMLLEDKVTKVSTVAIDSVAKEMLEEIEELDDQINTILQSKF